MKGDILKIEHMSLENGDGIRTTVFLKGCPLRCIWCHNPEGQNQKRELLFSREKCVLCKKCGSVCEKKLHRFESGVHTVLPVGCDGCGSCAEACVYGALSLAGRKMTENEVIAEVMKDRIFYEKSGGGMTLSGGEPLFQPEFSYSLCKIAKNEGINVCVQTCGYGKTEDLISLSSVCDTFMFDIKETDPEKHREYTGRDNKSIIENLAALSKTNRRLILTCPLIPGLNDRNDHYREIAALGNKYGIEKIILHPYHPLGISKLIRLGRDVQYDNPEFTDREKALLAAKEISRYTDIEITVD